MVALLCPCSVMSHTLGPPRPAFGEVPVRFLRLHCRNMIASKVVCIPIKAQLSVLPGGVCSLPCPRVQEIQVTLTCFEEEKFSF